MTTETGFPILNLSEGEPSKWNQRLGQGVGLDYPISAYQPYFTRQNRRWLSGIAVFYIARGYGRKGVHGKKRCSGEGNRKLSELYHVSEEVEDLMGEMLPDCGFTLLEADYVNAEAFETDLREFFQAMQCRRDKEKLRRLLGSDRFKRLTEETAWTIAVHLDRNRLETRIEKGEFGMCIALDELLADERAEGRIEGRIEGREEERNSIIRNMIQQGLDKEFISRITGCTQQEFASAAEV